MKRFGFSDSGRRIDKQEGPPGKAGLCDNLVNQRSLPIGHPRREAQRVGSYQIITYERFLPRLLQLYSSSAGTHTLVLV
jgi:hypothetical protein